MKGTGKVCLRPHKMKGKSIPKGGRWGEPREILPVAFPRIAVWSPSRADFEWIRAFCILFLDLASVTFPSYRG